MSSSAIYWIQHNYLEQLAHYLCSCKIILRCISCAHAQRYDDEVQHSFLLGTRVLKDIVRLTGPKTKVDLYR